MSQSILTRIYDILGYGRENAKQWKEIEEIIDIDKRQIEDEVRTARVNGIPICSVTGIGYYRGDRAEQIRMYYSFRNRRIRTQEVEEGFRKAIWGDNTPDEQLTLEELYDMSTGQSLKEEPNSI